MALLVNAASHDELPEADGRFPSGPWAGFFTQLGERHRTDLQVTFRDGTMLGAGGDFVGAFTVRGSYDTRDGRCRWTKSYVGMHRVFYSGYNEGRGIWGTWDIPRFARGGFHIWPRGLGSGDEAAACEEIEEPRAAPGPLVGAASAERHGGRRNRGAAGARRAGAATP